VCASLRDPLGGIDTNAAGRHVIALAPRAVALLGSEVQAVALLFVVTTAGGGLGLRVIFADA
jgi:hypothetical protein